MNKDIEDDAAIEQKPAKKKSVKKLDKDALLNKNSIEINPPLEEATTRTVVLGWGRMNPITSGHEVLVDKIKDLAKRYKATPIIYVSHSQDPKKNPLSYDDKIMLAKKAFGDKIIHRSNARTIMQIMKELEERFDKVVLVAGSDRVKEFEVLLNKYNGKDYNLKEIEVVSAGNRADPDSDAAKDLSAANMSASVMRKLASEGDFEGFTKGLPKKLKSDAQDVYDLVRGGMKIAEMNEEDEDETLLEAMSMQQRRARSLVMRKYKTKISAARKRLSKKAATVDQLKGRARKAAIKIIRKKIAGKKGEDYANLGPSEKMMIDKRVEKKKSAIDAIAKRLLPMVKKADLAKLSKTKNESFDEKFDTFLLNEQEAVGETTQSKYTKRYHQMYNKEGLIKLDARFRAFRNKKAEPDLEEVDSIHEEFLDDRSLLAFIEATAEDIRNQVLLDEEKSEEGLKSKSDMSGIAYDLLKQVYDRGIAAWQDSHRPGTTPQQWAYARVNSFIVGGNTQKTTDSDLWVKHIGKNESVDQEIVERSPSNVVGDMIGYAVHKQEYNHALKALTTLMTRKKSEAGEKPLKHGVEYYAAQIARGYPHVKSRELVKIIPKGSIAEDAHSVDDSIDEAAYSYRRTGAEKARHSDFKRKEMQQELGDEDAAVKRDATRAKEVHHIYINGKLWKKDGQPLVFGNKAQADKAGSTIAKKDPKKDVRIASHTYYMKHGDTLKEEGGAGDEGTDQVTKRYKSDTPGQFDEAFENFFSEEVTQKQLNDLEKFADRLLAKFNIDIEFTRHFAARMNDDRNKPAITIAELQRVFKKIALRKGSEIRKNPDIEAVLKDAQSDLNLPIVINYDRNSEEFEVINKTIMRKKNFGTSSKVIDV